MEESFIPHKYTRNADPPKYVKIGEKWVYTDFKIDFLKLIEFLLNKLY